MKTGIELITEERERQISKEGWTPEHDDNHKYGELADAGACYALANSPSLQDEATFYFLKKTPQKFWPFDLGWWKPTQDPVKNLVKAGALIAAEIDQVVAEEQFVSSLWARRFKQECPTGYAEAIRRAGEPVEIYETDETGEVQWAVTLKDGFWMDAFPTKEEAERLVDEMGWPIIGANVESTHANPNRKESNDLNE